MRPTEVEEWLDSRFIAAPGASLRREDRRRTGELAVLMQEIERRLPREPGRLEVARLARLRGT